MQIRNCIDRYLHDSAQEHAVAAVAFSNVIAASGGGGERKRRRGVSGDAAAAVSGPFDPKRQKISAAAAAASRPRPALPPVQQPLPLNLGWVSMAISRTITSLCGPSAYRVRFFGKYSRSCEPCFGSR